MLSMVCTNAYILSACAVLLLELIIPAATYAGLKRLALVRPNFRGAQIPAMFGLSVAAGALIVLAYVYSVAPVIHAYTLRWITAVIAFSLLGFVDDRWGDKGIKGLRGHFGALSKERRITTGLLKAAGGVAAAFALGVWIRPHQPLHAILAGLVIALSANAINLLDLRPGRAGAAFLLISVCALGSAAFAPHPGAGVLLLACVVLPALPAWVLDSRGKVMLGDTGSNLLGASLGLAAAESQITWLIVAALLLLVGLHVLAERVSLTAIIEQNRALNALDRLSGIRM